MKFTARLPLVGEVVVVIHWVNLLWLVALLVLHIVPNDWWLFDAAGMVWNVYRTTALRVFGVDLY